MPALPEPHPVDPATPDIGAVIASHRPAGFLSLVITWIAVLAVAPIVGVPFLFPLAWWIASLIALQLLAFWLFLLWLTLRESRKTIDFGTTGLQVRIGHRVTSSLLYADVLELHYFPMNVRVHGVSLGTSVILRIKPRKGTTISYNRMNPPASTALSPLSPLSDLDSVRDLVASALAHRMFQTWQTQGQVDWTKRLNFHGSSLTYKPVLGSRRSLPLHECEVVSSAWSITLLSRSTQKKFLEFPTSEPNTWPGVVLLLRLLNDPAARAADIQQ
jgi:hypothetical protein